MSVSWTSTSTDGGSSGATVQVAGSLDCTGYGLFNVTVTAAKADLQDAGVRLVVPTNPSTAFFAMGLGKAGGMMDTWAGPPPDPRVSWLVFDFGEEVTLDMFRLYAHGDGVHDVSDHFFQPATRGSSPTGSITWSAVVGTFKAAAGQGVDSPQDFHFPATSARVWRWVVTGVHPSTLCPSGHCQPDVAEVEFHEAGNKPGVMMLNTGTATSSLILSAVDFSLNAGGATPANPAWKAVDGYGEYPTGM